MLYPVHALRDVAAEPLPGVLENVCILRASLSDRILLVRELLVVDDQTEAPLTTKVKTLKGQQNRYDAQF